MKKGRTTKKVSLSKKKALPLKQSKQRVPKPAFRIRKSKAITVETLRSSTPVERPASISSLLPDDLPFSYGETKLVLLVRDPYWAYSYWDFSGETWNWVQRKLAEDVALKPLMRVHDLDTKHFYNLLVSLEAKNWYLHLGTPDHRYFAELGIGDGNSRFYLIARSNEVRTPRDSPSDVIDPEWSDRDFDEIYRLSGGGEPGLSSPGSLFFPRPSS